MFKKCQRVWRYVKGSDRGREKSEKRQVEERETRGE